MPGEVSDSLKGHSANEAKGVELVLALMLLLRGDVKKGVVPPLVLELLLPNGVVESCRVACKAMKTRLHRHWKKLQKKEAIDRV